MNTVRTIVDALGRDALRDRLGVSSQSISDAIREDRFPARWYAEVAWMGRDAGLDIPLSLFAFIRADRDFSVTPSDAA